jgi:hypothetical protein
MTKELPSPEVLRKLLRYEPETGKLFWREREREFFKSDRDCMAWNTRFAGEKAFSYVDNHGYLRGKILGQNCKAHRVIWAMQTGSWPEENIDHIDKCTNNNKWQNLRCASNYQNNCNRTASKKSTSHYLGVSWQSARQKWLVQIKQGGKTKYIGRFDCQVSAAKAYDDAAVIAHGEFASLNFMHI